MRFIKNPDIIKYEEALKKIYENEGYKIGCVEHTLEFLCPCKDFIESKTLGECPCGRYVKTEV